MPAAIPFPSWITPEIIPGLPFRWYGLMYVAAFAAVYFLFIRQVKERKLSIDSDTIISFFSWGILGLIIGARLFGTLVYDRTGTYWRQPWLIFWPFSPENGRFVGLQGMSYHGGLVGLLAGILIYAKIKKLAILEWGDMVAVGVPFGYFFGRIGNFINAELYGRVTALPWGMIFPTAETFSARDDWVIKLAQKTGISVTSMNSMVNLPRHPSQLYEALFEGIVLGIVMWLVVRKQRPFAGFAMGCYLIGYGFVRFFLEYFRAPDEWMGYIINLSGKADLPLSRFVTPWAFSMGQIFCFLMMIGGAVLLWAAGKRSQASPTADARLEPASKNASRNLRKRLK